MTDFLSFDSILDAISKTLDIPLPPPPPTPPPLIGNSATRSGLSPKKIAARIIARQSEAGIPVGTLPSGEENPAELMEIIRIEEIIKALQNEAIIQVAIAPGTTLTATGGNAGGPVQSVGVTTGFGNGYGIVK